MEVIPHHAAGEQPHVVERNGLGQDPLKGLEVVILGEDGEPSIGAIQTVVNESAFDGTQGSSHDAEFNEEVGKCQETVPDPFFRTLTPFPRAAKNPPVGS